MVSIKMVSVTVVVQLGEKKEDGKEKEKEKINKLVKIGEGTEFKIDIKTVVSIIVITSMFVGMYYSLQSDIEEAKKMPPAEIERMEYDLKQQWQTEHIQDLEEKVDEILYWCREVDGKLSNKKDK